VKISVIGGISLKSIYFQMHEESIRSEQIVGFLDRLQRYVKARQRLGQCIPESTRTCAARVWKRE